MKLGKFKSEYEGQILFYLRYLDKSDRRENEESLIDLIFYTEGNTEYMRILDA